MNNHNKCISCGEYVSESEDVCKSCLDSFDKEDVSIVYIANGKYAIIDDGVVVGRYDSYLDAAHAFEQRLGNNAE